MYYLNPLQLREMSKVNSQTEKPIVWTTRPLSHGDPKARASPKARARTTKARARMPKARSRGGKAERPRMEKGKEPKGKDKGQNWNASSWSSGWMDQRAAKLLPCPMMTVVRALCALELAFKA